MTSESSSRFCPLCGQGAAERFCAADGTATVLRKRLEKRALDYQAGHVVEGRYRVTGTLGSGGFGSVFSAVHTGTGQDVALKVLHVDLSSDNLSIVRRFWQEAQITSKLRHANTVRVFDVGQTEEGAFYLAMEQLHGQTLADLLEERARQGRALGEEEALHIGVQVCRSLQEAHRAGLVHRDLKPGNVMLVHGDEEPGLQVKVLDFGIARRLDSSLTGEGSAIGTPAYMSPEQCRGQAVDARSDLYALGAVLFRCVTGRVPFVDENALTVMFHHAETPVPDPRSVAPSPLSAAFAACIMRAMAKNPAERFGDAREMREALEATQHGVEAPTLAVAPRVQEPQVAAAGQAVPQRTRKASRLLFGLSLLLVLLGLAVASVLRRPEPPPLPPPPPLVVYQAPARVVQPVFSPPPVPPSPAAVAPDAVQGGVAGPDAASASAEPPSSPLRAPSRRAAQRPAVAEPARPSAPEAVTVPPPPRPAEHPTALD